MTKETKVKEMINAANDGVKTVCEGASANDVFSAYFTMAGTAIDVAKEMGVPAEALRQLVYMLLIRCDDAKQVKH